MFIPTRANAKIVRCNETPAQAAPGERRAPVPAVELAPPQNHSVTADGHAGAAIEMPPRIGNDIRPRRCEHHWSFTK